MRIVAIGDVGIVDDMIHIGDEAMFEEFATQTLQRGVVQITALSSNDAETVDRYGVVAVPNIGFSPALVTDRAGMQDRLDRVLETARGTAGLLSDDDPALAVIDAVRRADAVAIAGGGNMASIWPMHIFERACLGRLAALFEKPLVVSGQTIGPVLEGPDRALVAELLSSARVVGLRERASFDLVQKLGVPAHITHGTIDDASFVGLPRAGAVADDAGADAATVVDAATAPYCLVTLARHLDDVDPAAFAEALAGELDRIARDSGLEIVFLAHFASLRGDDERGDSLAHRRVIDHLTMPWRIEPTTTSAEAANVARGASLVVSSRYHPAVFAVAAGVPTIGIAVDGYTTVKLTGALGNFGQHSVVTAAAVVDGSARAAIEQVWQDRLSIRAAWTARIDGARAASDSWWDRVAVSLAG